MSPSQALPPAAIIAPAADAATCAAALCDADRLRPIFDKLARHETVRIVQIGDSHTAGDQVTGAWRASLQARYGVAGRGLLAPGRPYAGYVTRGVTASQGPGWTVQGTFGPSYAGAGGAPLGLAQYSANSDMAGATMSLSADDPSQWFDRFTVCGWQSPGAGRASLVLGAVSMTWSLDGLAGPVCRTLRVAVPVRTATVQVVAGRVTITSWSTERQSAGGVVLSNLGTVGSQLIHLERTDDRLVATEMRAAAPDLIVLAYGTNEAFSPDFSAVDYEAALRRGIARLRRLAPGVPILLLGAPDSATTRSELKTTAGPCPAVADTASPGGVWSPTAALPRVQAIQRHVAHQSGIAYWDWAMRMGGRCTADAWSRAVPPLMRSDRVHFTRDGGAVIARLLQDDLDAAARQPGG